MGNGAELDGEEHGAQGRGNPAGRLLAAAPTRRELAGLTASRERGIDVEVIGIGREAARRMELLMQTPRSWRVMLSLGFAGALDPDLRTGDIVVASAFIPESPAPLPGPIGPTAAVDLVRSAGGAAWEGQVLTVDEPLLTAADKRRARSDTGALAVDMEGSWVAGAASVHGVYALSLRAVIDEAAFELPAFVARIIADGGRREWLHTLAALRDPRALRSAASLAMRARRAAKSLRRAADAVIPALLDGPSP